ncbi:GFA family protein [Alteromonas aestuariivivens]|uniref:GFA family protein n=1 Tax=Alteromonas aestuariivivens TaxID=1938339 RepID=A0A3D8MAJ4_9ALTE|nr:GFA family protein [Alteromonas aestuariivivens]RDV26718.1 GFA family protein [Alteromonas aestuariivivens]
MSELNWYKGSCHCGKVTFEVECEEQIEVDECNCSICNKSGYLHLIVPKRQFALKSGEENLTCYTFNTGVAKHYFCRTCGIKAFYIPRSNPDGYSVNARCLDQPAPVLKVVPFDGQNWEQNAASLAHKSQ